MEKRVTWHGVPSSALLTAREDGLVESGTASLNRYSLRQLNDLELTLTHHGYRLKEVMVLFDARTADIRDRQLAIGLLI